MRKSPSQLHVPDKHNRGHTRNPEIAAPRSATTIRQRIQKLIRESRGDTYASVSALLGRSHSYLQQYVKRKSPDLLRETDRRKIARHFGIDENELLLPEERAGVEYAPDIVMLPYWTQPAQSAGISGSLRGAGLPFLRSWFGERFSSLPEAHVVAIVTGDAMVPTLHDGDCVMIDTSQGKFDSDGLYALATGGSLRVRRLSAQVRTEALIVSCDNPRYPEQTVSDGTALQLVGKVVWTGCTV